MVVGSTRNKAAFMRRGVEGGGWGDVGVGSTGSIAAFMWGSNGNSR